MTEEAQLKTDSLKFHCCLKKAYDFIQYNLLSPEPGFISKIDKKKSMATLCNRQMALMM
jgi:hypothetical protein